MSLLQLEKDPAHRHDASSDGEDLAKGSSYLLWTTLVAAVLISVGITVSLLADRKPPPATGEVTQVWVHAVHTINTPIDANGVQTAGEIFDQVLVFAQMRVKNQSDKPIVMSDMLTNVTFDDGIHSSSAAGAIDYDRVFIAYPELAGLRSKTLVRETVIAPGQTLEGMIVSSFHVSKEEWAAGKNLSFTIQFKYHPDLVLVPPAGSVKNQ